MNAKQNSNHLFIILLFVGCLFSINTIYSRLISSVSKTKSINIPEKSSFRTFVINNKIYLFKYGPDYDIATAKDYEDAGSVYAYDPSKDKWETKMKMPVKKVSYSILTINGKVYVIGGFTAKDTPSNSVEMYDPENDSWSIKKSIPTARSRIGTAVYNNMIYTFGGWTKDSETDVVEVYDPATNNWSVRNKLPEKLMGVAVTPVNNKIYYLRAVTSSWQFIYDFKEYDPLKDSWTKKAPWNFEKQPEELIAVNGRLYVAGGGALPDSTVHSLKEYDITSNRWIFKKNIPVQSMHTVHFSWTVNDGKIYTFGGGILSGNGWIASKYANRYDPVTDTWEELEPLSEGKIGMSVACVGNKIFLIGGELMKNSGQSSQNEYSDKMEVYEIKEPKADFKITFSGHDVNDKIDSISAKNLNTGFEISFPGNKALILKEVADEPSRKSKKVNQYELKYSPADIILFKCMSGKYTTIITDSPKDSKNISVPFYSCTDSDGNNYAVVKIGTQIWMAENLRTKKYNNGDPISTTATTTQDISKETSPKYQWIYNDDEKFLTSYGRLYTWDVVIDKRGIAPKGWHVPSKEEYAILINYLGGTDSAGVKLKVTGNSHWLENENCIRTNSSGFTAVPGGARSNNPENEYIGLGHANYLWTTTPENFPFHIGMFYDNQNAFISSQYHPNYHGFSVRCVKTDF